MNCPEMDTSGKPNASLVHYLRFCADRLEKGEYKECAPLRELQRNLRGHLGESGGPADCAVAFYMTSWVERYYRSLSGGFPSKISLEVRDVRVELLEEVLVPTLRSVADALENGSGGLLEALGKLAQDFYGALEKVRVIAEEQAV